MELNKRCLQCDTLFGAKRSTAKFCSDACKIRYNRSAELKKDYIAKDVVKEAVSPYKDKDLPDISAAGRPKPKPKPKPVYKTTIMEKVVPHETGSLPGWEHSIEEEGVFIDNTMPEVKPGNWLNIENNMPKPGSRRIDPEPEEEIHIPPGFGVTIEKTNPAPAGNKRKYAMTYIPSYSKTEQYDQAARLRKLQGKGLPGEK